MSYLVKSFVVRYPLVTVGHERQTSQSRPAGSWVLVGLGPVPAGFGTTPMVHVIPSYNGLMATAAREARPDGSGALPPAFKNKQSLLRKAAGLLGIPLDSGVDALLTEEALDRTTASLSASLGMTPRQAADLTSALRWWARTLRRLYPSAGLASDAQPNRTAKQKALSLTLRAAIKRKRLSQAQAATGAGVPLSSLERWLKGRLPDGRSVEGLRRLAVLLGLEPDDLLCFVSCRHTAPAVKRDTGYSAKLKEMRSRPYRLAPNEISGQLRQQWRAFVDANVDSDALLFEESTRKAWKVHPLQPGAKQAAWHAEAFGGFCPTADRYWNLIHGYLSWIARFAPAVRPTAGPATAMLEAEQVGYGVEAAQTLAWLAVPQLVRRYLDWRKERAGGENNGCRGFLGLASALCAKPHGWLRKQESLASTLPTPFDTVAWSKCCDAVLKLQAMSAAGRKGKRNKVSRLRDPFKGHLKWHLEFVDPFDPVVNAINTLVLEADALSPGSKLRATRLRDAALLALLLMLPVRLHTGASLEWGAHIWQEGEKLGVNIPKELLKNGSALGRLVTQLEGPLVQIFLRYTSEARPILAPRSGDRMLFVRDGGDGSIPWKNVGSICTRVTGRLCEGYALAQHEFRHLVATRYLRLHPQDYVGVARLLHDSLKTVLEVYAPDDPTGAVARNAAGICQQPGMRRLESQLGR